MTTDVQSHAAAACGYGSETAPWQAKHRQDGDFLRSTFYETSNIDEIQRLVAKHANMTSRADSDANSGLQSICRYRTERETFLADRQYSIMLDSTDFGHWVGEVELQRQHEATALYDIDNFMSKYAWFFRTDAVPKGKMSAYFELFGYPSES